MIPDDVHALVVADAIGALDPDERLDLQDRLAALPPAVRDEVTHLYDAAVEIAATTSSEAPSPDVRAALFAKIVVPSNHTVTASDGEWVQTPVRGIRMKILTITQPQNQNAMLDVGAATNVFGGYRKTSEIGTSYGALAAVNGDFAKDGYPVHMSAEDGDLRYDWQ